MVFLTFVVLFGVLATFTNGVPVQPSGHKPFIIGGEDAPNAYAPHMVAMVFGSQVQFFMCGGSIISRQLVLTAAHCLSSFIWDDGRLLDTLRTYVGSNKWNSGGTLARIKDYYKHPLYDAAFIKYDVAVLVLQEKLEFNDYVGTIKLGNDFVEGNEPSFVTGWGQTGPRFEDNAVHLAPTPDDLQILYVMTVDHDQCQEQMTAVAGISALPIQRDIEICTFHSRGHGMCFGDSGSALVRMSTNEQIGIVSWGKPCATGAPDIFVRVSGVRDFVDPILNKYRD